MGIGVLRLIGADTITITGKSGQRLITDLPHGEVGKLTFPTDLVTLKVGKNSNAIYASNQSGNQVTFELKVLRGSGDDMMLNSEVVSYKSDPTAYVLLTAEVVKVIGDGSGNITDDTYQLAGGVISKQVEVTSNVEGDVEQGISHYTMQFVMAGRSIAAPKAS